MAQSHAQWYVSPVYPNGGDLAASYLPEEQYLKQMKAHQYAPPAEVGGEAYPYQRTSGGSGVYLRHTWGDICYGLVPNASENSTVYGSAILIFPLPTRTRLRAHPYRSSCRRAGIKF